MEGLFEFKGRRLYLCNRRVNGEEGGFGIGIKGQGIFVIWRLEYGDCNWEKKGVLGMNYRVESVEKIGVVMER